MKPVCDVIVLTWNQLDTIKKFVDSFLANTFLPSRLIIIDNGSNDNTPDYLKSLESTETIEIEVILNKDNKGFVGGMNQGICVSDAPYVCLANNDLIFTPGWLKEIKSVFDKYEKVGVLNPNSNSLGCFPAQGVSLEELAESLREKHKAEFIEMPFCIGFCMVIKREVILKAGALSTEFYPMFFEDTDYSMKARSAGFFIGMAKSSYVWHDEHKSFKQWPKKKEMTFVKSRSIFEKKWGRILRIAWIVNDINELKNNISEALSLARKGNFVWVFVRKRSIDRGIFLKENNLIEHSGINFIRFENVFDLTWKILKKSKKKRYGPLISNSQYIKWFFNKAGYTVLDRFEQELIDKIKKSF